MHFHAMMFNALLQQAIERQVLQLKYNGDTAKLMISVMGMKFQIASINKEEMSQGGLTSVN